MPFGFAAGPIVFYILQNIYETVFPPESGTSHRDERGKAMRFRKYAAAALICGLCLGFAGCKTASDPRAQDAARYRAIAEKLDPNGSYYRIMNPRYVLEGADKLSVQLFSAFTSMQKPPENFREILDHSLNLALLYRLSGIEDVQGIGESSLRLSGEHEQPLFRNRLYLAIRPGSRGFLWNAVATGNRALGPAWSELPAGIDSAFELDLRPDEVYRIVSESAVLAATLHDERLAAFIGEPPEKLLAELAGTVRIATLPADEEDPEAVSGSHLMFSFPDKEGKLFAVVKKFSVFLPGTRAEEGRIQLGPILGSEAPKATPVVLSKAGRITVFSSVKAEQAFTSPAQRFADSDKFRRLSAGLPAEGVGFLYSNESYARAFNYLLKEFDLDFAVNPKLWTPEQLIVIVREESGFLATGNSTLDSNQNKIIHQILIPAAVGAMAVREYLADSVDAGETVEEIPDTTGECQITLELFKDALKKYAEQHDGAFPAGEDLDGVRELLKSGLLPLKATICPGAAGVDTPAETVDTFGEANCSFVYFGGFTTKSNPKLPLVVDWPLNHEGAVNVLLVDGTIEKLDIDAGNCKRIVSKLQTIYQYKEKEFRRLIELADKLDKKFGLDQQ